MSWLCNLFKGEGQGVRTERPQTDPKQYPQRGHRGDHVKRLQLRLSKHGFRLTIDGIFGPDTEAKLKMFQATVGLPADGRVNLPTYQALNKKTDADSIVTAHTIAMVAVNKFEFYIDKVGLRETDGPNRSVWIDTFNSSVGAPLGSPYCASGLWYLYDDTCKRLGLINPMSPTAASQSFRRTSYVPEKYIYRDPVTVGKGWAFVLQNKFDVNHGHVGISDRDQDVKPFFHTMEFNTDIAGDRDGDGAYRQKRDTVDFSVLNSDKRFICVVDIPQWIADVNNL